MAKPPTSAAIPGNSQPQEYLCCHLCRDPAHGSASSTTCLTGPDRARWWIVCGTASPAGRNRLRSMTRTWDPTMPGVLRLPSGRLVRGRGLRRQMPEGPLPDFGLYLLGKPPAGMRWDTRWLRWPDFRLPADQGDARDGLREAWRRAADERVEVACGGGRGRTGTALACLAVLDGVPLMRPSPSCESTTTLGRRRRPGSAATSCDSSPPDGCRWPILPRNARLASPVELGCIALP
jgi:hypothetical protein